MNRLQSCNAALRQLAGTHLARLAHEEVLAEQAVAEALLKGTMVLLGNPAHQNLAPILVGQPARVKINANIGTSALCNSPCREMQKLSAALSAGADTVMDLSVAGDLRSIRQDMLAACPRPLGTVPLYAVAQRYIDAGRDPARFSAQELFEEIEAQAEQGVDYMTVHCGITSRAAAWARESGGRVLGIVSRGGAILARWMRDNNKENPLLEDYASLLRIAARHNVTLSLGDALRPGAGADAGDAAQWAEVITLGRLAAEALQNGVQSMIEGPGHVPMQEVSAQVQGIKKLARGAPLYVLGPLVIDSSPGYDHIAGAIGGALAVQAGADFLCYLTPAEHLTLPEASDVVAGVMASRIAAQAGEIALGRPQALQRERAMSEARQKLDWPMMQAAALDPAMVDLRRGEHGKEEACAMCGEFCAVKMLRPYAE
ncbi:MAG: phosphomethylpyrimidine synthase ThiC [Deltaproteobacteria bacterium]|jgi:phosphomethylpyrimidine synthase|nr:phosphomethylpyrimidine synthase ThiC [Deltaproteobacteria bacterium]